MGHVVDEETTKKIIRDEFSDLDLVLLEDAKNYHAWQYRIWLVQRAFVPRSLFLPGELSMTGQMLRRDILNNSAWNHRLFIKTCEPSDLEDEVSFAHQQIDICPANPCPWRYLGAIIGLSRGHVRVPPSLRQSHPTECLQYLQTKS